MSEPPVQVPPDDVLHVQRDDEYRRQAEAEAAFWDGPHHFSLDAGTAIQEIGDYLNERFTGDRKVPWYATIPRYGAFRRGCVLGGGSLPAEAAVLAQNPSLHLTIFEISAEAIARRERELGARFPGRVELREEDLNFLELPEASYDLVFSNSCMHHLLNLEHVAAQINRCLTAEGRFFLHDYVGESRFQFSDEKKRAFQTFVEESRPRHPELEAWYPEWPDVGHWESFSPFEAIRAGDTLDVLDRYLDRELLRTAGAFFPLMLFLRQTEAAAAAQRPRPRGRLGRLAGRVTGKLMPRRRGGIAGLIDKLATEIVREDRRHTEAGVLRPAMAFAVYRKKGSA